MAVELLAAHHHIAHDQSIHGQAGATLVRFAIGHLGARLDAPVVPTDQHGATLVGISIGHLGSNLDALGVHPGQPGATLGGLATGSDVVGNGQN